MGDRPRNLPYSHIPGHQSRLERTVERSVVLLARVLGVSAFGVAVYAALTVSFFACCGVDGSAFVHPAKSPFGWVVTVSVVWPVVGLLCVVCEGALEEGVASLFRILQGRR